jgi:hypothetical protein
MKNHLLERVSPNKKHQDIPDNPSNAKSSKIIFNQEPINL